MRLFGDRSARRELWILAGLTVVVSGLLLFFSPLLSVGALVCGAAACCADCFMARRRYQKMAALSERLSRILHSEESMTLDQYTEGELSVLQSELQKLLLQLQSAKQSAIEDKQQLADSLADISHQLRTPLTSIELIAEMLRSPSLPDARRQELYRDLSGRTQQLQWLVDTLLKLSQLDAGTVTLRPEQICLDDLLESASSPLLVPMELRNIRFQVVTNHETLVCDRLWTAEAIGNLLKNAIEHSPVGGTITVCAEDTPVCLQLTVHDDGNGFPTQDLPHLFERFYRGSNAAKGSYGIGLSLTRRILSEENATIRASNAPQGGALFTIRFYKSVI